MTSLVELGYGLGWSVVKALPRSVVWPVFRAGADRSFRGNGPGTQRLRRNLRQVVGPEGWKGWARRASRDARIPRRLR